MNPFSPARLLAIMLLLTSFADAADRTLLETQRCLTMWHSLQEPAASPDGEDARV